MANVSLIVNATAGSAKQKDTLASLEKSLSTVNGEIEVLRAGSGSDIADLARNAAQSGAGTLAAAGGDGTLNTVASAILRSGSAKSFGVVPLGTLNHFAKDAGIPLECEKSVPGLLTGIVQQLDAGEVNGEYFLNNSSIGAYPEMVVLRDNDEESGTPKVIANLKAIFRVLRRSRFMRVTVSMNGKSITRSTPLVFVGNNPYEYQGLSLGKRPTLHSGRLGVLIPRVRNRLGLLWLAVRSVFGLIRSATELDHYEAAEVTIETGERETLVSLDGEVRKLRLPLRYRSHPRALRVIIPRVTA